jgi:hypothetical protein
MPLVFSPYILIAPKLYRKKIKNPLGLERVERNRVILA